MLQPKLYAVGVVLLFLGFAMIVLGSFTGGNATVGGFVLIGPIPIVFGSGKDAGLLAILSVAAGLIMIVMVYLTFRQTRGMKRPEPPKEPISIPPSGVSGCMLFGRIP